MRIEGLEGRRWLKKSRCALPKKSVEHWKFFKNSDCIPSDLAALGLCAACPLFSRTRQFSGKQTVS